MIIDLDSLLLEPFPVCSCAGLAVAVSNHYRAYIETALLEFGAKSEDVFVVGDSEVSPDFVLFDVDGADYYHYFRHIYQVRKHLQLAVRLETGEHPARMEIVEEFTSKLHVEFVSELGDTFLDVFRLYLKILLVVET